MRKVLSVSLDTNNDSDIFEILKSCPNRSQFVKDAIRAKGKEPEFTKNQMATLRKIILEVVGSHQPSDDTAKLATAINDCLNGGEVMSNEYVSCAEKAAEWGIKPDTVRWHIRQGNISGVIKIGNISIIPKNAKKPIDGRLWNG